jgi:uracil-DNA glycosylase
MLDRCPPTFLRQELSLLRPDWVVGLGHDAIGAIAQVTEGTLDRSDRALIRGQGRIDGRAIQLIGLLHPSWPQHARSIGALLDHPIAAGLTGARS